MAAPQTLLLGILLAASAGPVFALGATQIQPASPQPTTVHVPSGAVGDQVVYARFERNASTDAWRQTSDMGFLVAALTSAPDQHGSKHDAVQIVLSQSTIQAPLGAARESSYTLAQTTRLRIGLDDRTVYNWEIASKHLLNHANLLVNNASAAVTYFGPISPRGLPAQESDVGIGFYPFNYAQRSFTVGRESPVAAQDLYRGLQNLAPPLVWQDMFNGDIIVSNFTDSVAIAGTGQVDGEVAVLVRTSGCLHARIKPAAEDAAVYREEGIVFLHTRVPDDSQVCYEIDVWLAATSPYPVLYHERTIVNGTRTHEWLENLAQIRHGQQPISWNTAMGPRDKLSAPTSGSQRHPADGDTRLTFPLSAAVQAAQTDPTLVGFHQWRASHPSSILAGARLEPLSNGRLEWDLTWATPSGAAFVVSLERALSGGQTVGTQAGEFTVPRFRLDDYPIAPITIGAAEALWRDLLRRPTDPEAPNDIRWGLRYREPAVWCETSTECDFEQGRIANGSPEWLWVGTASSTESDHGAVVKAGTNLGPPGTGGQSSLVVVHTSPAYLWISYHGYGHVDFIPLDARGAVARTGPAPVYVFAPSTPVSAFAVAVSSSALALVLGAYFWPILRFVASAALGPVLGYAKIHKSALLEKKSRDDLVNWIRQEPGASTTELVRATGQNWGTTVYHLRVLEKNRLISSVVDGRHKRFFPLENIDWSARTRAAVLRNRRTRELFEHILHEPGLAQGELARRLGISQPAIYWHVRRLQDVGLIGHDKLGRRVHYYPHPVDKVEAARDAMEVA